MHHMQLPDRSPADASSAVGATGMHSQAGERAAMTGLISANQKNPWKVSGIKASFIPRHKQAAVMESPFVTEGQSTTASPGRQQSRTLLQSLFKNKHKIFTATIASCMRNASGVSPQKCHAEG